MLYVLFIILAIAYNVKKFRRERTDFLHSIVEAKSKAHREMILGHHFHVFIFEGFLAIIVAHLLAERSFALGIVGIAAVYLVLLVTGLILYQWFLKFLEKQTALSLRTSFNSYLIKEFRVSFALIMLPILVYSVINLAFQDSVFEEWGNLWFVGLITNIIFVSVVTISCSVIIMLRLIPNREVTEPEYLEIIQKRLQQINMPKMRVRWIETDIKNAFVVGLKLLKFSNQTMFLGKGLRTALTMDEFDAVIAHELAHVANRHIHKRVIELLKNFLSIIFGLGFLMITVIGLSFVILGEEVSLYTSSTATITLIASFIWFSLNYALFFDSIRSHEYEADAYAVINLGAAFNSIESALRKLSSHDEMPEFLKAKTSNKKKGLLSQFISRYYSTHPQLEERISSLKFKLEHNLPFNYYISPTQKLRRFIGNILNWKVLAPLSTAMAIFMFINILNFKQGSKRIALIKSSPSEVITSNEEIEKSINSRPLLLGKSLMYYIVTKRDPALIDYYLDRGAKKGKSLVYISEMKDFSLFERYYTKYGHALSEDEYFLILRKTAELNFVEGYRYLVNSKRFELLNSDYKEDIARVHRMSDRSRKPASQK